MEPLKDIRVLSVTVFLAGPFLGMTLARFGAEVIKVEIPGIGDPVRNMGPYGGSLGISATRQSDEDLSVPFMKRSEGVKCVSLNLKDPRGREMFLEMAKQSDVLIENLSPGALARMELGYSDVAAVNPGIVYCSISGYGQTGPYKNLPAHDQQIQAMSGIMDMNGDPDGPPTRVGVLVGDLVTPLYAAYSILAALRHKEQTGQGQYLDASMIDSLATLMLVEPMEFVVRQGMPVRAGNGSRNDVSGVYHLVDGDVMITVTTTPRWERLCRVLGMEEHLTDPRYSEPGGWTEHCETLGALVQEHLGTLTCEDAIERLTQAQIPISLLRSVGDVIGDDHLRERGTFKPMRALGTERPVDGGIVPGFPVTFSGGPLPAVDGAAPLGHHNSEIYGRLLGLDDAALADLEQNGII